MTEFDYFFKKLFFCAYASGAALVLLPLPAMIR